MKQDTINSKKLKGKGFDEKITLQLDGNMWVATGPNFTNLQETRAGFGEYPNEAVADLFKESSEEKGSVDIGIDIQRCIRAMENISVEGVCNNRTRESLVEEAISKIVTNPENPFSKEFLGLKNYAHFSDQRCDCSYGCGPRHGSIVFSIGRQRLKVGAPVPVAFGDDEIYLLECVRDFPGHKIKNRNGNGDAYLTGLCGVINRLVSLNEESDKLEEAIFGCKVELQANG